LMRLRNNDSELLGDCSEDTIVYKIVKGSGKKRLEKNKLIINCLECGECEADC
jgi:predicted aldo/keto reductase-like oxidoreductase